MKFKKGQIIEYSFPQIQGNDKVLTGKHKAVVLFSRDTPHRTALIAPITSAESLKENNKIPQNYLELKLNNYIGVLDHDSYVNLDMIFPVDDKEINELKKYNKKLEKTLIDYDLEQLDYKIALTYELQKYLKKQINNEVKTIVEYIDINVKEKIKKALVVIEDKTIFDTIMYIIEHDLIGELKEIYN
ncbi:type II toxin-antitoxin system PemK/MazF family toxin [Clostridium botulinum]|uniref:type II toxin-antitoxin system PemK/MazF family toxin n=1 Tax=Clostridium botulinum TaxID=1491 RepID=UPI001C9B8D49|nr:type II toxin-antitoxin system PemK/MazF family toxin [Clostridium botulinum]MBY6838863.1 type II toxin-antitoxin system PemK/MazF family toxin [Clostridium botulinum]